MIAQSIIGRWWHARETYPESVHRSLWYGLYDARPAPGNTGARYVASDGGPEWVDDGSVWRPLIAGHPGTQIPPVSDFTQYGGATFSDSTGTIVVTTANVGAMSGLMLAKSTTAEAIVHVSMLSEATNGIVGLAVRDSATQTQIAFGVNQSSIRVAKWTDDNTFVTDVAVIPPPIGECWLRFVDDGVNHLFYGSVDSVNWKLIYTEARAAFVPGGGNQCGPALKRGDAPIGVFDSFSYVTAA